MKYLILVVIIFFVSKNIFKASSFFILDIDAIKKLSNIEWNSKSKAEKLISETFINNAKKDKRDRGIMMVASFLVLAYAIFALFII